MRGLQSAGQHLISEVPVGQLRHLGVEGEPIEDVHAHVAERSRLLVLRHQTKGRGVRLEPATGMGLECDHAQRQPVRPRGPRRFCDHLPMPQMHAIEIAKRHRRSGVGRIEVAPSLHDPQSARVTAHRPSLTRPRADGAP